MGIDKLINELMPSALKVVGIIILYSLVKEFAEGSRGIKLLGAILVGGLILYIVKDIEKAQKFGEIIYNLMISVLSSLEVK